MIRRLRFELWPDIMSVFSSSILNFGSLVNTAWGIHPLVLVFARLLRGKDVKV